MEDKNTQLISIQELIKQGRVNEWLNGSSTTSGYRADALAQFTKNGFPNKKIEAYKYTDIEAFIQKNAFNLRDSTLNNNLSDEYFANICAKHGKDFNYIFLVNGLLAHTQLLDSGLQVQTIPVTQFPDVFYKKFDSNLGTMAKMNIALSKQITQITVENNTNLKYPLRIVKIVNTPDSDSIIFNAQVIVSIGINSTATFFESIESNNTTTSFNNQLTLIDCNDGCNFHYYNQQTFTENTSEHHTTIINQSQDSTATTYTLSNGGCLIRNNLAFNLLGKGAQAHLNGFYFPAKSQHIDNQTQVNHLMPNCQSNELYKGIAKDAATGIFNGKIWVEKDAQKTNAFQTNNNMLLSKDAKIYTKPQLEIFADDVKCSHGATIGKLDEDALYYLQARGISKPKALGLLLEAFAYDTLSVIKEENITAVFQEAIQTAIQSN